MSSIGVYVYAENIRNSIDMSSETYKEIYYWNRETPDKPAELTALGGVFNKKMVYKVKSIEDGYTILQTEAKTLPFKLNDNEDESKNLCSKNEVPLTKPDASDDDEYRRVKLKIDNSNKILYIDLDNGEDGRNHADELDWYLDDDGKQVSGFGIIKNSLEKNKLDYVENPFNLIPAVGLYHSAKNAKDIANKLKNPCVINLFAYINTSVPNYDLKSLDSDNIYGRVLGDPSMNFNDWVRVTDNKRDYIAVDTSAQNEIPDYCKKIGDSNNCTVNIYKSYQKCYNWSNGLNPPNFTDEFTKDKRLKKVFDNIQRKTLENNQEYWNHSFRENTSAFIDCFGQRAPNEIFNSEKYFKNPGESRALGEKIIQTTAWPESINPNLEEKNDEGSSPNKTTCSIGMLGWILCPTLDIVSKMTDALFSFIDDWLDIPPFKADRGSGAYQAWRIFRDMANVIFVISLLVVIIGQLIGGGLFSNYNIKKLAPKIILIAIAINTSFYLISIMIDISNIIGSSLYEAFKSITTPLGKDDIKSWTSAASKFIFAGGAVALTIPVLTSLSMFIPLCIAAGFSVLILLLLLIFRQAIVIVMVIISPLAIACMLMPNTKSWFSKWKKILFDLVWLYPVIAIIFGASKFASAAIIRQGQTDNTLTGELLSLFGLAVQFLPLFITPFALKFGGSTISNIGGMMKNRTASLQNKAKDRSAKMGGFMDRFNEGQIKQRANRIANGNGTKLDKVLAGRFNPLAAHIRHKSKRDFTQQTRKSESDRLKQMAIGQSDGLSSIAEKVGGGFDSEARQQAEAAIRAKYESLNKRDIYTKAIMKEADMTKNQGTVNYKDLANEVTDINKNLSHDQKEANIELVVNSGDFEAINSLINNLSNTTGEGVDSLRAFTANNISKNNSIEENNAHLNSPEAAKLIKEGKNLNQLVKSAYDRGEYTPEAMAKQSVSSAKAILNAKNAGAISNTEAKNIANNFYEAKKNPSNSQHIKAGVESIMRNI